jgi:hypothetical protein
VSLTIKVALWVAAALCGAGYWGAKPAPSEPKELLRIAYFVCLLAAMSVSFGVLR